MTTRIFCYDTEFLEDGKTIELISIGIVCDDGREYYAVNSDMPMERIKQQDWLVRNVLPSLPLRGDDMSNYLANASNLLDRTCTCVKPKFVIANEVRDFITGCIKEGDRPSLWADYGAYDHVVLAQLYGPMIGLPDGIPMFTNDLQQLLESVPGNWELPVQEFGVHNALEDARHVMTVYQAVLRSFNA